MFGWLTRKREKRSTSYTDAMLAARFDGITASNASVARLTATVQGCVSLWEAGLASAEVTGTDVLSPGLLAIVGRSLGLSGESVLYIGEHGLVPASQWDLSTSGGLPVAYRLALPDIGGGRNVTALSDEVLHFRIGSSANMPWSGTAPLARAPLTASLLHAVEDALAEVYQNAPIGSQIAPMPEQDDVTNETLARSFRGKRGRVLLRESVNVSAAGGPAPVQDWRPSGLTPDLSKLEVSGTLGAARDAVCYAFGVLPAMLNPAATGPVIREAQRHLAQWMLSPMAHMVASEATAKLGGRISLDVIGPLRAYDAAGRARALSGVIRGLADAKESGLSDEQITAAIKFAGVVEDP